MKKAEGHLHSDMSKLKGPRGLRCERKVQKDMGLKIKFSCYNFAKDEPYLSTSNQRQTETGPELFLLCRQPFFA